MSQTVGQVVLQKVAEHYEANPESWCTGYGTLKSAFKQKASIVSHRLKNPDEDGCIYTMIRSYARVVAGDGSWQRAAKQAVKILTRHHRLWFGWYSITNHNDVRIKSAHEAVDFIDAALGAPAKPVPMHACEEARATEFA